MEQDTSRHENSNLTSHKITTTEFSNITSNQCVRKIPKTQTKIFQAPEQILSQQDGGTAHTNPKAL